jgi:hypothetical protein
MAVLPIFLYGFSKSIWAVLAKFKPNYVDQKGERSRHLATVAILLALALPFLSRSALLIWRCATLLLLSRCGI